VEGRRSRGVVLVRRASVRRYLSYSLLRVEGETGARLAFAAKRRARAGYA
jgi:hypothetical protein